MNNQVITYALDWDGRRVARKLNGVNVSRHTFESPLRVAMETNEAGVQKHYVYGSGINSPDYMTLNGENFRIVKDHLGSPRLVISANTGTIVQRMDFNEWGEVLFDSNPGFQGFGFAGGLYDEVTKLVKFGARDYSPAVGRWLSKDPIGFAGGDANLYGYVLQDPVNFIDPSGLFPWGAIGTAASWFCRLANCTGGGGPNLNQGEDELVFKERERQRQDYERRQREGCGVYRSCPPDPNEPKQCKGL